MLIRTGLLIVCLSLLIGSPSRSWGDSGSQVISSVSHPAARYASRSKAEGWHRALMDASLVLYRGNQQRTGFYEEEALNQISGIKWQQRLGPSANAGPIFAEGTIYIGCLNGRFYAIDSETGQTRWSFKSKPLSDVFASAALVDGTVYAGAKKWLYALDAQTGALLWKFKAKQRIFTAPVVAEGAIFFGVEDGKFYAVDLTTRQQRWKISKRLPLITNPAFEAGTLYIPTQVGFYAVNSQTGAEQWKIEDQSVWYSPAITDGIIYVGNEDGRFYALQSETGALLWSFNAASGGWSSPAIRNGVIFVGNRNHHFYALNSQTGERLWEVVAEDWAITDPIVVGETVYFGVGNHDNIEGERSLYALDAQTGGELWKFKADSRLLTASIVANRTLYVVSIGGTLYALH